MASPDANTTETSGGKEPPVEFDFSDPDVLRMCLQMLGDEGSQAQQRQAIEILIKLCRNIMLHPGEEKYVKIRKENKAIHDRVLRFDGAREFLLAIGWSEVDDMYMFLQEPDLSVAISILDEQLNTLPASQASSPSSTNTTTQSPSSNSAWTQQEISERDKKIEEDRKKRMDQIKRMKKEREEIKKQIKADRKDTSTREVQDSHAKHFEAGVKFKKFENTGGGG